MKNQDSSTMTQSSKPSSGKSKSGSMQKSQLMELFEDELKDIYWAESALLKAIPKMIKNATSEALIEALTAHLEETKEHVSRLEQIFKLIKVKAEGVKCEAMVGLIKEAEGIMDECETGSMCDAGIISAAQKVEHYEIATYGTLRQFAETLNMDDVASILGETLREEKEADQKLTEVARDAVNVDASEETA